MFNFTNRFVNMFSQNASKSACSSCVAVNDTTAAKNDVMVISKDTVFSVSFFVCIILVIISLALLGLINILLISNIIISIICLTKLKGKSETQLF